MQAIINVNKNSAYAHLNGLTFTVCDFVGSRVAVLNIEGTKTDFSVTEVLICDLQTVATHAYNNYNWDSTTNAAQQWLFLENYIRLNRITFAPVYTCPA